MDYLDKFRPILYFHQDENFYPVAIPDYLIRCSMWNGEDKVLDVGQITSNSLSQIDLSNSDNWSLRDYYPMDGTLTAPVYGRIMSETADQITLQYIFFYSFNSGYLICCHVYGNHHADIEHVTITVNKTTNKIDKMFFGAHGYQDGRWIKGDSLQYENERPIVYVARGSHACYPTSGTYYRIYFLANDHCGKGKRWDPQLEKIANQAWLSYRGNWGFNHVTSMNRQSWWFQETEITTTALRRIFVTK